MKSRAKLLIVILAVMAAIVVVYLVQNNGQNEKLANATDPKPETTIRNSSKRTVIYWIKESAEDQEPMKKSLKAGEIHRYPGNVIYEVTYKSGNESVTDVLPSDTPYAFRQDEEDSMRLYPGSHGRSDAEDLGPFVPTPMEVVDKMLAMVKFGKKDVLYDLGCGDGRIVIAAAKKFKIRGVGIDIDPKLIRECREKARQAGVDNLVSFIENDISKVDISEATVVTIYLLPEANEILRPQLENQLKPGTFIICHNYPIPGWDDREYDYQSCNDKEGLTHSLFLYRL